MNILNQALVVNQALEDIDASNLTASTGEGSLVELLQNRTNVTKVETGANVSTAESSGNYVLFFNDGMTFEFPSATTKCTDAEPCKGVIDAISGPGKGMNKVTSNGTTTDKKVKTTDIGDRWPVKIYASRVEPNSHSGRLIMYGVNSAATAAQQGQQQGGGS